MNDAAIRDEVWRTIQSMNRLWTADGRPDDLAGFFHRDMVAISPADRSRIEGREACVAAWKAFSSNATIHSWKELDPRIDLYGDGKFAVVTYYFDMSFETGGTAIDMGGRDMFSLVHENGRWWVVADQFSPYPS